MPWNAIDANNGLTLTVGHIDENLDLLQNCFRGTSAPASPVEGQLWYKSDTDVLQVYDGSTWKELSFTAALTALSASLSNLAVDASATATAGTSEESTRSTTLAAGYFSANGKGVEFEAVITTAANANDKQISIDFGSATLVDSTALALNDATVIVRGRIWRRASNSQIALVEIESNDALLVRSVVYATATETDSGTIALALRLATPDNAGDAAAQLWRVFPTR